MSRLTKLVVLYSGIEVSPFLRSLVELRIQSTIVVNTLMDFKVEPEKDSKDKKRAGGWIQLELISLASAILPDDLTKSPLASLFSRSKMINIVPMSPSEQFLAAWFSELRDSGKAAHDSIHELFRTLTNYNSLPIEVYPLSFAQKEQISLRYRDQRGPPRAYQKFGFLDFAKPVTIEAEDFKAAIIEEKDFSLIGFNPKETIISTEIEKIFREADALIITAFDFPSLVSMLSYKDVRKSIKKSNATVIAVSPVGSALAVLSAEEEVILQVFGIKPDIHGFMELMQDVADIIVIDEADSDISSVAQETGFNVVVGKLKFSKTNEEFIQLVIKAAGLDIEKLRIKPLPDISSSKIPEIPASLVKAMPTSREEDKETKTSISDSDLSTLAEGLAALSSQVTVPMAGINKVVSESIFSSASDESIILDKSRDIEKLIPDRTLKDSGSDSPKGEDDSETEESEKEISVRELIGQAIKEIEQNQNLDLNNWIDRIHENISQDESHEVQTGNSLLKIIAGGFSEKIRSNATKIFMKLSTDHSISFRSVLQSWIINHLSDPDFGIHEQQAVIFRRMATIKVNFIGKVLESFTIQLLTSKHSPAERERGRSVLHRTALHSKKLAKSVIRSYLSLFDDADSNRSDIWLGLSGFEAQLVGIEIVQNYSMIKCQKIAKEAQKLGLGSFSILLDEIIQAWASGDIDEVIKIVGTLTEEAARKAHRLKLATNIKKIGTIPLETLARSLKEDPKELESLVYEMVMNDEIQAKLEIVDGRLYIMQLNED